MIWDTDYETLEHLQEFHAKANGQKHNRPLTEDEKRRKTEGRELAERIARANR